MPVRVLRAAPSRSQFKIIRATAARSRAEHVLSIRRAQVNREPPRAPLLPSQLPSVVAPVAARANERPAARARRTRRRVQRLFDKARRAAQGQARLRRADQVALLRAAYIAVRCWERDGIAEAVERELRSNTEVATSQSSSLFLLLLRCALPRLDPKRSRKMAAALDFADHHAIPAKRLSAFLRDRGGIEGAARDRARLRDERGSSCV